MSTTKSLLTFLACLLVFFGQASADRILVLGALPKDLTAVRASPGYVSMGNLSAGPVSYENAQLCSHSLSLISQGPGGPENATVLALVANAVKPDLIISLAPAGALSENLKLKQIVLVNKVVPFQRTGRENDSLVAAPEKTAQYIQSLGLNTFQEVTVGSGEAFVTDATTHNTIRDKFHAHIVDMNSFGISVAANILKIPFIALRIISDTANESSPKSFQDFTKNYNGDLGQVVGKAICALPDSKTGLLKNPEVSKFFSR